VQHSLALGNVRSHQTARSTIQTPAMAEIWNKISASCAPLLHL